MELLIRFISKRHCFKNNACSLFPASRSNVLNLRAMPRGSGIIARCGEPESVPSNVQMLFNRPYARRGRVHYPRNIARFLHRFLNQGVFEFKRG